MNLEELDYEERVQSFLYRDCPFLEDNYDDDSNPDSICWDQDWLKERKTKGR
jgi:hypothetical protein